MKIFGWLADNDGCGKYRIMMPLDALAARGHEVQYNTRINQWGREEADIVIAQRTCNPGPSFLYQKFKAQGKTLVFELDDNLFALDPRDNPNANFFSLPQIRHNLTENIRLADLVTVSTEPLAEVVRRINPNVVALPNSVNETIFDIPAPARRGQNDGITVLGWQGSATHANDWAIVRPHVAAMMEHYPGVRMRFLGNHYLGGLPADPNRIDFLKWTTDLGLHYKRVSKFDVGLAPLAKTTFTDSKSAIRAVEYHALGLAGIYSRVPAYEPVVDHGVTGFLARNPEQWGRFLRQLIEEPAARLEIGNAARDAAKAWTIEARAHLWEEAYGSLL